MIPLKSLENQLFFVAIAPLVFIIACVSIFFLVDSLDDADKDVEIKGQYLSEQVSLLSEFYLYTGNLDEIENIAELMLKNKEVDYIRFFDTHRRKLVGREKGALQESTEFSTPVYSSTTIIDDFVEVASANSEQQVLGYIHIGLSDQEVKSKKETIYRRIFVVALVAIFGGFCITYLFSRQLLEALNALKKAASRIEQKQLEERCEENGSGELLKIQQVFNNMADSIQLNEKYLQEKIKDATQSLNNTIGELSQKNIELDKTRKIAIDLERSKAISEERARIMKDMHDGIGGQLVASLALLEKESDSRIRSNISEILSHCLDDFRLIINSINPGSNILLSLLADFKYRINKRLDSINIDLHWQLVDLCDKVYLHPQQSLHILRILQESFSNIIKHANASAIYFSVTEEASEIWLRIEDNGRFTSEKSPCGQGLTNMKWRASQLQGDLVLSQSQHGGYCVALCLPKSYLTIKYEECSEYH